MGLDPHHVAPAQGPGEQFGEVTRLVEAVNRREHQFDRPLGGKSLRLERIGKAQAADREVRAVGTDAVQLALDILPLADPGILRQAGKIGGQVRAVKLRRPDHDRDNAQFVPEAPTQPNLSLRIRP